MFSHALRGMRRIPLSGEFSKVAEEDDRRLEMTGSVGLDRFIVETDLLSVSLFCEVLVERVPPQLQRFDLGLAL